MKLTFKYDPNCQFESEAVAKFLVAFQRAKFESQMNCTGKPTVVNQPELSFPTFVKTDKELLDSEAAKKKAIAAAKRKDKKEAAAKIAADEKQAGTALRNELSKLPSDEQKKAAAKITAAPVQMVVPEAPDTDDKGTVSIDVIRNIMKRKGPKNRTKIIEYMSSIKTRTLTDMDKGDYDKFYDFLENL